MNCHVNEIENTQASNPSCYAAHGKQLLPLDHSHHLSLGASKLPDRVSMMKLRREQAAENTQVLVLTERQI